MMDDLSKGLNFAITPTTLPVEEIIAGTEVVAKYMTETAAEELKGEVLRNIKRAKLPKSNISKGERVALQTLKKDNSIIILPAVKGRATVIMNTAEYREKMTDMVGDTNTYPRLSKVEEKCHSIKNTKGLVNKLRGLEIPPARNLVSYDVTTLFTSVPVDKALEVITQKLDCCLNTTYFIYDGAYYQQTHYAAIRSPNTPFVANCYMEQFEKVAISIVPHPPPITVSTIRGRYIHRT